MEKKEPSAKSAEKEVSPKKVTKLDISDDQELLGFKFEESMFDDQKLFASISPSRQVLKLIQKEKKRRAE